MQDHITWSDCSSSRYLQQDDIVPKEGRTVTIEKFERQIIEGKAGEADKEKVCVKFKEFDKWLVLNSTNGNAIKKFTNSTMPLDSEGKQIEIFVDPSVSFGGKIVGGIRLRPASGVS